MTLFHHLDPVRESNLLHAGVAQLSRRGGVFADAITEAGDLAFAAASFFKGICPIEAPYLWWGEGSELPWFDEYCIGEDDAQGLRQRTKIEAEMSAVARELRRVAWADGLKEPSCQETYLSPVLCESTQLRVQGLAVEALLCIDGYLDRLARQRPMEALAWQAGAFTNLIEALVQANELTRTNGSASAVT